MGGPIFALVVGLFMALMGVGAWMALSHEGFGSAAIGGVLFALSSFLLLFGISKLAKKKLPVAVLVGVPVALLVLGILSGPSVSSAHYRSEEEKVFAKCDEETSPASAWVYQYEKKIPLSFRRAEYKSNWMEARVREALKTKSAASLRQVLVDIDLEKSDKSLFKNAKKSAKKALSSLYDEGKAKLYAPPKSGAAPEFPVDEALRRGFGDLIEQLTESKDANVYVAFTNKSELSAPAGTDESLKLYQNSPKVRATFPKGNAPIIDQGKAFSPDFDKRRRATFITAMGESFGQVFNGDLITLVPLEQNADRKGRVVIEVGSRITRKSDFFVTWHEGAGGTEIVDGLLFAIQVEWQFKIVGRDGKVLYQAKPMPSEAADHVKVDSRDSDPNWAMYSIMMDSAYYNYSREVTGRFGLTPPPVREVFSYVP